MARYSRQFPQLSDWPLPLRRFGCLPQLSSSSSSSSFLSFRLLELASQIFSVTGHFSLPLRAVIWARRESSDGLEGAVDLDESPCALDRSSFDEDAGLFAIADSSARLFLTEE